MEDEIKILKETGKASIEALEYSRTVIKEGVKLLDAAELIENFLIKKGYELSFPINLSINEIAAHYTPGINDVATFHKNDVVKVDLGARKGDALSDCAITLDLSGNHQKMVETAEFALEEAISIVKAGRKVCELGAAVEKVVSKNGFKPILNLGGHGIDGEELHTGAFIPNFDNGDETELQEGDIISIEPFITNGFGHVSETNEVQIFQLIGTPSPRTQDTRKVLELIKTKYLTYPFSLRWLANSIPELSEFKIRRAISELLQLNALEQFPVLIEKEKGIVVQAEKELLVEKDSCIVLTKL